MKKPYAPEGMHTAFYEAHSLERCCAVLAEAAHTHTALAGKVIRCDCAHNLHIDFGKVEGILPREQVAVGIQEGLVRDIAILSRVNKVIAFYVEKLVTDDKSKPYALLNRRALQEDCRKNYLDTLQNGDVLDAVVTRLEPFGAFCDVGAGWVALLPIDHICVSRIPHPSARFFVGQNIKVILKSRAADGKLTLSHKELLGTWAENAAHFHVGETVPGIIRSIEEYGIFIELAPNLAGLAEYAEGIQVGESASVFIKNICPEKMKIKLTIIDHAPKAENNFSYLYPALSHITHWQYSPKGATKEIFSMF